MSSTRYTALFKKEGDQWFAEVVGLPACHTYGDTFTEAYTRLDEALKLFMNDPEASISILWHPEVYGGVKSWAAPPSEKPFFGTNRELPYRFINAPKTRHWFLRLFGMSPPRSPEEHAEDTCLRLRVLLWVVSVVSVCILVLYLF